MDTWHIGVLGAGKMGVGIAQLFAMKGCPVTVVLVGTDAQRGDARPNMEKNLAVLAENGVIAAADIPGILDRVNYTQRLEDLAESAHIVFECVVEKLEVKQALFHQLDEVCPPSVVLASNTSAISITEIAQGAQRHRERVIGTHYWNPAYLIPLVEVIKPPSVSQQTVDTTFQILRAGGKEPVLVEKDVPGFLANRLQHALFREAISIVEHGIATPEDVDRAIKYGFGMRIGISAPFEVMDMGGLDLTYDIHSYLFPHLEDTHEPQKLLMDNMEAGRLGFKTGGHGFVDRTEAEMETASRELIVKLIQVSRALDRL